MGALLEAQDLFFQVHEDGPRSPLKTLLAEIHLQANAGKILAITGPSGSGKSTLLQLLCRMMDPTQGALFYQGKPYTKWDPQRLRREITLVFQSPALLGPTVRDDLFLGDKFCPEAPADSTIAPRQTLVEMLRHLHLTEEVLQKKPSQLSLGEAQRVALGRALWIGPKVLLLDEPTASLDMNSKLGIEETLLAQARQGLSVILVSHEERQVKNLANHGIELQNGRVVRSW